MTRSYLLLIVTLLASSACGNGVSLYGFDACRGALALARTAADSTVVITKGVGNHDAGVYGVTCAAVVGHDLGNHVAGAK